VTGVAKLAFALLALLLMPFAQNQKKLLKLENKFQEQKDAVHRAKALAKLLPKEVEMASHEVRDGHMDQAIGRLEQYRDQVVQVHQELLATGRNPVKKSSGFKELQISLRESVRKLRDLIFNLPLENRQPFEAVRQDLSHVNNQLLQELFPPRPPPKKKNHHILGGGRP
jgi:uncharacterized coiled-coil DUF342 family protein